MTWIRVDTDLPTEPVIGQMCERLGIDIPTAVGLFVCTQLGFADHRTDAMVDPVPNISLEQWSYWGTVHLPVPAPPGAWASTFRELCTERRDGQRDPNGRIKGWWRNEALIRKQLVDRQRRKDSDSRGDPGGGDGGTHGDNGGEPVRNPPTSRAGSRGNVDVVDGNENEEATTTTSRGASVEPVSSTTYVQRCVGAANKGLRENPSFGRGRGFNELTASSQDAHQVWIEQGIPVEVAERAVYERARKYRPSHTRPQPSNLKYFSNGVLEDWDRERSRLAAANLEPPAAGAAAMSEGERIARQLERQAEEQEVGHA